ncbi:hypothetical protein JL193_05340 [Polaribacter batillariae]|uniref:Pimeloyl-ACP methyl ester carboxylesterase n=1 Tax=Polaribacter batillariae TaxID=2808900 RepID=A0ABX7SWQ2_9FLAO|nr:hypothetical protein [Polaribacter batillariae]QTD38692.1 hypothetical protein JL193_05340 [Polaribacter batillariae]
MKKTNHFNLIICAFLFIAFSSCNKDEDITPNAFDQISEIATFHGNLEADIVVVNTQGGPITQLEDELLDELITGTGTQSALYVNVHQEQTKNPAKFTSSDITFEQAKQYDLQSVVNLKRVVDFFKNQKGKTVYVLGISFGAFMTQELIATHGIDVADGYLIMVGRLDIDEGTWQPFSQGKYTQYIYDNNGNYTINSLGDGSDAEERNMARLAAGLGYNRYTDRLSSISDLSKITYIYGNRDEQVGPLSVQEIQFLKGKNANVILSNGGDHDGAIDTGLNLLKQIFGIE